ncbi:MAG TPA: hypothetical protein VLR90_08120 [Blastocatellia bacterium]|nr:hypothetical protein [Blastocatellia bacterium]
MKIKYTTITLLLILAMAISTAPTSAYSNSAVKAAEQTAPQHKYTLRPPAGQGSSLSVVARSTRQVQIQVTDENDKPVPDLAIIFSLSDSCLGVIGAGTAAGMTAREKTDNRGIATVPWVIGAAKCAGSIAAKVEGTSFAFTYQAAVRATPGWQFDIEEGKAVRKEVGISNTCLEPHIFRIKNEIKYIRFEEPTNAIPVGASSVKQIGLVFDTKGLKSKVYSDKLVVECRDCKKGGKCNLFRHEITIEMNVIKK